MADSDHGQKFLGRRLLIVSFEQFGYHTDTYEYCRYLRDRFKILYLCPDQGLQRHSLSGVDVVHLDRHPLGKVELGLLTKTHRLLGSDQYHAVFLRRTKFSFLLRLLHPRMPMIFDVRSGSVEEGRLRRRIENGLLLFNATFFRNVSAISAGLVRQLGLPGRAHVLPLGANRQPLSTDPLRDGLRLVYVGTFKNRHLERTVEGLALFVRKHGRGRLVHYDFVGFGSGREVAAIEGVAAENDLADVVRVLGRVDRDRLPAILAENNVGVAFTPCVPWFEHQPSTKVFEYLQSGLMCIATDNSANREVISSGNGVLVEDDADGFCHGLELVADKLPRWDPRVVAASVRDHTWERIVNDNLVPFLEAVQR